jgi:hypothetical protein
MVFLEDSVPAPPKIFWVLLEGWAKVTAHSPEGRQYGAGFCNFN